jgi:hypothetical protein
MKIGILVIASNRYKEFFDDLYKSLEKNFLPNYEKVIFYFNDSQKNMTEQYHNVVDIKVKHQPWPGMTLYRYKFFNQARKQILKSCVEYLFYVDADMRIVNLVDEIILPKGTKTLTAVFHPGFYNDRTKLKSHETNPNSSFFVPKNKRVVYIAGGFQGGKTKEYLDATLELSKKIDYDYKYKKLIPIFHDESAWNFYLIKNVKKFNVVNPEYCYPEKSKQVIQTHFKGCIGLTPRILALEKNHKEFQK